MSAEESSILCLSLINKHYSNLGNAEKRVADFILKDWKRAVHMAVARIAEEAAVSQATVVRFCRSLGFSGIADFRLSLRNEKLSNDADYMNIDKTDSEMVIANKVTLFNKRAINDSMSFLDGKALSESADLINSARKVIIMAEGGSGSTARSIYDSFLQIDIPCTLVTDAVFLVYEAARAKPEDVILTVCHSGRIKNIIDAVKIAKEAGVRTISIIGILNTPLVKYSDILLYTGLSAHPYYSEIIAARICELNVISALHTILGIRNKDKLQGNRERISQLLEMKRI